MSVGISVISSLYHFMDLWSRDVAAGNISVSAVCERMDLLTHDKSIK